MDFVLPFMRRWQPTPRPPHRDSTDSGWGAVPSHRGVAGLQQSPLSYVAMPKASAVCPSVEGLGIGHQQKMGPPGPCFEHVLLFFFFFFKILDKENDVTLIRTVVLPFFFILGVRRDTRA